MNHDRKVNRNDLKSLSKRPVLPQLSPYAYEFTVNIFHKSTPQPSDKFN